MKMAISPITPTLISATSQGVVTNANQNQSTTSESTSTAAQPSTTDTVSISDAARAAAQEEKSESLSVMKKEAKQGDIQAQRQLDRRLKLMS
jgi:hypothetical protein